MKRTPVFLSVTFAVVLFAILTMDATYDRHPAADLFKVPSVSALNTQEYSQSILQNAEKDIVFLENLGQIKDTEGKDRPDILFLTRSQGVDMYMTNSGISYVFRNAASDYYRLDMEFVGMNKDINIKKEHAVNQQYHYYNPEYPDGISPRAYKKVIMENLYEGIDLVYYEKEGRMKYDFILKAGADAGEIKMKYKGATSMDIDNKGNVIIETPMGEIRDGKPYTYSGTSGSEIESRYQVKNNTVLFDIAKYNESEDIIIDPLSQWATYYGGTHNDIGTSICTDNSGFLYITGRTKSSDFPTQTLTGAYNQTTFGGGTWDIFIVKFNSSGARIWATYYGGSVGESVNPSICTDNSGNLYVAGATFSSDFPTQALTGAYNQTTFGGTTDAFILKFNSSGARIWATYYGGSALDDALGICTDSSGNLYVTGQTLSNNFPTQTLTGAYNQTTKLGRDAFILKFNSSGERIWATYYGGPDGPLNGDIGNSICTDNSGNLYVTGQADEDLPVQTLSGAYNQTTFGGGDNDAFILKFNSSGARIWATYYGGVSDDYGNSICADSTGNIYVTGQTEYSSFPVQSLTGAYNQSTSGGGNDAFIIKFNSSSVRQWATYYGGSGSDEGLGICTDISGNLYVTGSTGSSNFPTQTLTGAYNQTTPGGGNDAFLLRFNGSSVRQWATYYGGSGSDDGLGICIDNSGRLYVTGATVSSDFPTLTLTGAYNQSTLSYLSDAFILRFDETIAAFSASDDTICEGDAVSFTDQSLGNIISWDWTFEGGTPGTSTAQHPSVTYNTMGTYDVQLIVSDGTYPDTIIKVDHIHVSAIPTQPITPTGPAETCEGGSYNYTIDSVAGATSYEWMVEPSDAGTISGSGTTGTYTSTIGWTGVYTVKVRASNYCGSGAWSADFTAELYHSPVQFSLIGEGAYCDGDPGAEIILDGSETGVDYELFKDNVTTGVMVAGTGDSISFGYFQETGIYLAEGFTDHCSEIMIGEIYVHMVPIPGQAGTPQGEQSVCTSDTIGYFTSGAGDADDYQWILYPDEAGTMIPDGDEVSIIWDDSYSDLANLSVYGTNACGDGPVSDELEITVLMAPAPEISGLANVCSGSTEDYMTLENPGNTYDWEVSGGTIVSGAGTYQISVEWGDPGSGYVVVTEDNGTCSTTTEQFEILIGPTGIGDNGLHKLKVYPNPAGNALNIDLGNIRELKDGMIILVNIHGHVINSVKVIEGSRNIRINTSGFAQGLYWVQMIEDDRVIAARKVVIMR